MVQNALFLAPNRFAVQLDMVCCRFHRRLHRRLLASSSVMFSIIEKPKAVSIIPIRPRILRSLEKWSRVRWMFSFGTAQSRLPKYTPIFALMAATDIRSCRRKMLYPDLMRSNGLLLECQPDLWRRGIVSVRTSILHSQSIDTSLTARQKSNLRRWARKYELLCASPAFQTQRRVWRWSVRHALWSYNLAWDWQKMLDPHYVKTFLTTNAANHQMICRMTTQYLVPAVPAWFSISLTRIASQNPLKMAVLPTGVGKGAIAILDRMSRISSLVHLWRDLWDYVNLSDEVVRVRDMIQS